MNENVIVFYDYINIIKWNSQLFANIHNGKSSWNLIKKNHLCSIETVNAAVQNIYLRLVSMNQKALYECFIFLFLSFFVCRTLIHVVTFELLGNIYVWCSLSFSLLVYDATKKMAFTIVENLPTIYTNIIKVKTTQRASPCWIMLNMTRGEKNQQNLNRKL